MLKTWIRASPIGGVSQSANGNNCHFAPSNVQKSSPTEASHGGHILHLKLCRSIFAPKILKMQIHSNGSFYKKKKNQITPMIILAMTMVENYQKLTFI